MSEVAINLADVPQQTRIRLSRSFFNGPNGFTEYMKRPEVQQRRKEWEAKKNEAAPAAPGTTSSEISDTNIIKSACESQA